MAGFWVAFDAEEGCDFAGRQGRHEWGEVGLVEDFGGVAVDVGGGEFAA